MRSYAKDFKCSFLFSQIILGPFNWLFLVAYNVSSINQSKQCFGLLKLAGMFTKTNDIPRIFPKMLAGHPSYPKRQLYPPENKRHSFPLYYTKIRGDILLYETRSSALFHRGRKCPLRRSSLHRTDILPKLSRWVPLFCVWVIKAWKNSLGKSVSLSNSHNGLKSSTTTTTTKFI